MKVNYWIIFIFFYSININAQLSDSNHSFLVSTGIVLEDGFIYNANMPILGFGYNYKLNNTFSLDLGLNSIYKNLKDNTNIGDESINIVTRNSQSLFISQDERNKIIDVGIKDIRSDGTRKYLYLPLNLGISVIPIRIKRSSLGFAIGVSAIYGSYKASRDQFTMNITLKDGTIYENVTFKQEIEFRNFIIGDSYSRLYYMFDLGSRALQFSLHSYNLFWSHDNTETNHLLSFSYVTNI